MIYSIGKRVKNYVKLRIYKYAKSNSSQSGPSLGSTHDDGIDYELKKYYYDSGRLKAETCYINGKLEGIANYYYESGDLKAREFYKNNQLNGLSKWYYESGEVKSERYYKDGTLINRQEFDKSGRIIRSSTTD